MKKHDKSGEIEQRWTLAAMILVSGTIFFTGSAVNVALPRIGRELGADLAGLQWIVDGYILTLGALMIPGGSLGDRFGRGRMMTIGMIAFAATSIACGLAISVAWLIGARLLQGVAAALLVPGALAVIRSTYTDREARGQAVGIWSGSTGVVTVIGPLLGGWLVDALSWRWAFFVNLPLIAAALWLLITRVETQGSREKEEKVDWLGVILCMVGLGGIAYGLIQGPVTGWTSPSVLAALIAGLAGVIAFPMVEARVESPMVPLDLFSSRNFSGANLTTLGVYAALQATFFLVTLHVQNIMGQSALTAGLVLAPISLLLLVLSPTIGKLAGKYGARLFMTAGPLGVAVGALLLSRLQPSSDLWRDIIPAISIFGLGLSVTVAPLTDTVISAVRDERSGIASAFNNVVSRIAGLLAVAVTGAIITVTFGAAVTEETAGLSLSSSVQDTLSQVREDPTGGLRREDIPATVEVAVENAYSEAFQWAMITNALLAAAGGIVAFAMIRNPSDGENGNSDET